MEKEIFGREGFQQNQDQHLTSKEKEKHRQTQLYFKIPQAKPLLSKIPIDIRKPKVLIRDFKINLEYPQVLKAKLLPNSTVIEKSLRREHLTGETTLWKRYVASNNYKCLYMKYQLGLEEGDRRGKRLRTELQKATMGNEWLLATFILDMSFLADTSSLMLRNLVQGRLSDQLSQWQSQKEEVGFDSRFENGNLMFAFVRDEAQSKKQYHLILQNDVNTRGYANWFYFKVYSVHAGPLRIHIINLQKNYSFFGQGMRPVIYSLREGKGWSMEKTSNIAYTRSDLLKTADANQKYSSLSFTIDQSHPNDILLVAAAPPYTYSRLLQFLESLEKQARLRPSLYFRRESLAQTISNNECPMITVTWKRDRKQDRTQKKVVVIIARQHPLETVSSWVAQGLLSALLKVGVETEELLRKYIFKVVPMLNVDGVIYGNSRCDIAGADCNRKWTRNANSILYPAIAAIRKLVTELIYQGQEIQYFFDLHGHSRKLGSFIYGCKTYDEIETRMFAWLLSKATNKFVFQDCRFGVSPFRRQTARGYMGGILNNRKAMTLETSFFGYRNGIGIEAFNPTSLSELGQSLLVAMHWDTFRTNNSVINWTTLRSDIKQNIQNSKFKQDESQGSDSDPEGEQFSAKEKAATFLSPTVASKIGLIDIKVVQKPRKIPSPLSPGVRVKQNQNLKELESPLETPQGQKLLISQSLPKNKDSASHPLRQTKSVTKIQSFRFKAIEKKPTKRIRIAIDVQRQEREPRLSAPILPLVRPRNSIEFWRQLREQCQNLIEKKTTLLPKQLHQSSKVEH